MKIKEREFIFEEKRPFISCHASTLVKLPNGDFISAWFGGSKEGADDTAIWISRRSGTTWAPPEKVSPEHGIPHWNPVLFNPDGDKVHLFYKVGETIPGWYTMHMVSEDGGISWAEPAELVPHDRGGRGPVKNKPIVTSEGYWMAPASIEDIYWDAFVDISQDGGRTWTMSDLVRFEHTPEYRRKGIIQPSLWESKRGVFHMLLRSTSGRIFRSDSVDGGKTWAPAYPTWLPNNNSGIDLANTADGTIGLVYNPVGMYKGPRSPLILSYSTDNGQNWIQGAVLEDQPGEYSYPAIISDRDEFYITYTWKRERIVFARVKM